jgi:hypothetical protein
VSQGVAAARRETTTNNGVGHFWIKPVPKVRAGLAVELRNERKGE